MEEYIIEYFKFNNTNHSLENDQNSIKIIDELNPIKLLKTNIDEMIDKNIYNHKNINYSTMKFNIDYSLYKKIITNDEFGTFVDSVFLFDTVYDFVYNYMEKNKLPILAQYTKDIYNFYKEKKEDYEFDISLNNGSFLYELIIKNKLLNILEIKNDKFLATLFLNVAIKNLKLENNQPLLESANIVDIPKFNNKFDLIFISKSKLIDNNKQNLNFLIELLNDNGYLVLNNVIIDDEMNLFLRNNNVLNEKYELEGLSIYRLH
jgi:hypothetical protein